MIERKPCPFCGCHDTSVENMYEEACEVGCAQCGAFVYGETEEIAIQGWNSRYTPSYRAPSDKVLEDMANAGILVDPEFARQMSENSRRFYETMARIRNGDIPRTKLVQEGARSYCVTCDDSGFEYGHPHPESCSDCGGAAPREGDSPSMIWGVIFGMLLGGGFTGFLWWYF